MIRLLGWEGVDIRSVTEVSSGGRTAGEGSQTGLCALAQGFRDRDDNVPNVVAAVDAVVLEMRAPTSTRLRDKKQTNISSQYCRKGFFATTMLAFVDVNMRFLSVSINCGSSSHDSTLFGC